MFLAPFLKFPLLLAFSLYNVSLAVAHDSIKKSQQGRYELGSFAQASQREASAQRPTGERVTATARPQIAQCLQVFDIVHPAVTELLSKLPKNTRESLPDTPWLRVSHLQRSSCEEQNTVQQARATLAQVLNHNGTKVGVLLPLASTAIRAAQEMRGGIDTYLNQAPGLDRQRISVLDSGANISSMEHALANLIFVHDVSVVVGGLLTHEAQALANWSEKLAFPLLMINGQLSHIDGKQHAFSVFPSVSMLAVTTAQYIQQKKFRRVAILQPQRSSATAFSNALVREIEALKDVSLVEHQSYQPDNFESMEVAARRLFKVDHGSRQQEYRQLYRRRMRQAEKEGVRFNPNTVMLNPVVDVDAVIIADHFRHVRHMINIFKYLGVEKIPLIGNHEWRSQGLIMPVEPFLNGAFFTDFIGSYLQLPRGLQVPTAGSPYFTRPQVAQSLDHRLVGYLSVEIAHRLIEQNTSTHRRHLSRALANLTNNDQIFLPQGRVFNENRQLNWPKFSFIVSGSSIQPFAPQNHQPLQTSQVWQQDHTRGQNQTAPILQER